MAIRRRDRTPEGVRGKYFEWLIRTAAKGMEAKAQSFRKLFKALHETGFVYILEMDENRAMDGEALRYRFARETGLSLKTMDRAFFGKPCSVMEMMAALARRCEEQIAGDPDQGDRTGEWFFEMIESLGLTGMDDTRFDPVLVDGALSRFMNRAYQSDGRGGLFTLERSPYDLRKVEIWYQRMDYLNERIYADGFFHNE